MDLDLRLDNKCRICLMPDKDANFIHLNGLKAAMFTEVIGVELTNLDVKTESVICQNCFSELENFHDFKAKGIRAHREYFEIQRQLATQRETNDIAQAADLVELTGPGTTAIEPYAPSRVKHEPPVEFVFILPRATIDRSAEDEDVNDSNRKWVESVHITKFDAKWKNESRLFQTFLTCQQSRLVVKQQRYLSQHLKTCNKIKPARFECDICGERFQMKRRIDKHMQKHSNEKNFRCSKCGKGFKSKCNLTAHKKIHSKTIACSDCQKKFARNQHLKAHQMQHRHGIYAIAPEKTFDCGTCDKTFSNPKYLKDHQRYVHDENGEKCNVCGKVCRNRASLLYHSQTHTKVECSICHKMVSKRAIASHVRSHASHFGCDLCDLSTNDKGNLKKDIERHLLDKLVKDSKCRGDFSDLELLEKLQLKYRTSSTSVDKKFQCDKCEKLFVTPRLLNGHKWKVHPEKLFDCHICKKAYKTKSNLKQHKAAVHA